MLAARVEQKNAPLRSKKSGNFIPLVFGDFRTAVDTGRPAAELGEPRAGTEGNASQQSTGRAQNWETVTQALARIRQAAFAVNYPR